MKKSGDENRFGLVLVIMAIVCILIPPVFSTSTGEKESGLKIEEEAVLFTPEGYYRAPPALPDEVRKNLAVW
jgi:hypothetical protein